MNSPIVDPNGTNPDEHHPQLYSLPLTPNYQPRWFAPERDHGSFSPEMLLRGVSLPDSVPTPIAPNVLSHTLTSEVATLTRALAHRYKADSFTTILTDKGTLFFGMDRNHAHPNCRGHSVECAAGIAVTSGHHSFALVATYDNRTVDRPPFDGLVLERLAEHFCCPEDRAMKLMHVTAHTELLIEHSKLLPFPHGGVTRPRKEAKPHSVFRKLHFNLYDPNSGTLKLPDASMQYLSRELRSLAHNSTADGETRPGRKRHAACVFTAEGDVYFGVNLRSDVAAIDRCAEWNALSAALIGGHKERIAGVMVYSPDYDEGSVSCCGRCLNSLGDCIDPDIGDMLVVYMDRTGIDSVKLFTEVRNTSYGVAEGRPLHRPSGDT